MDTGLIGGDVDVEDYRAPAVDDATMCGPTIHMKKRQREFATSCPLHGIDPPPSHRGQHVTDDGRDPTTRQVTGGVFNLGNLYRGMLELAWNETRQFKRSAVGCRNMMSLLAEPAGHYLCCCEAHELTQSPFLDLMAATGRTLLFSQCTNLCIGCRGTTTSISRLVERPGKDNASYMARRVLVAYGGT